MRNILPLIFLILFLPVLLGAAADTTSPAYKIIVNPENPVTTLDRAYLSEIFLRKVRYWSQSDAIKPADLSTDSLVRKKFTEDVLKRSVGSIKNYWQQRIFSGRDVPPPELMSDNEVIKFVLKNPGGIGYVSGSANLHKVKVVGVK